MSNCYNYAANYQKGRISSEIDYAPKFIPFKAVDNEKHIIEKKECCMDELEIAEELDDRCLKDIDKTIIHILALFSASCCTNKNLIELMSMIRGTVDANRVKTSLFRLCKLQYIKYSKFEVDGEVQSSLKAISLTNSGKELAKSLDIVLLHSKKGIASAKAYEIKSYLATAQFICNYLKHIKMQCFKIRPMIIVNPQEGKIVRPSASIALEDNMVVYIESPRRHPNWIEDVKDKLDRYSMVFCQNVSVILNCEDEEMSLELSNELEKINLKNIEVIFTDDRKTYGDFLKSSLYNFSKGQKQVYEFNEDLYFR